MAHLNKSGNWIGGLANTYIRVVNGRSILCSKPGPREQPRTDIKTVSTNNKFRVARKFAKHVNDNLLLREIWSPFHLQNNNIISNTITSVNLPLADVDCPTLNNKITPDGPKAPFHHVEFRPKMIKILHGSFNLNSAARDLTLCAVIFCYDPKDKRDLPFYFFPVTEQITNFNFFSEAQIIMHVIPQYVKWVKRYYSSRLFLAAVAQDESGNIVYYSSTSAYDFSSKPSSDLK